MEDSDARGRNAARRGGGGGGGGADEASSSSSSNGKGKGPSARQQEFAVDPQRDDFVMATATAVPIEEYYSTNAGISGSGSGSGGLAAIGVSKEGAYAMDGPDGGGPPKKSKGQGSDPGKGKGTGKDTGTSRPPMLFEQGKQSSVKWPPRLCAEVVASFDEPTDEVRLCL